MYKIKICCFMDLEVASESAVAAAPLKSLNPMMGRNVCFTVYHWTGDAASAIPFDASKMCYLAYQHEKAPTTGRDHLQGFVSFHNPLRRRVVQGLLNDATAHVEAKVKGSTFEQAAGYCQKGSTRVAGPWVYGVLPTGQGHRSDLDVLTDAIKSGQSMVEVVRAMPKMYILHHSGIQALYALGASQRDRELQPEIIVNIGVAGSGKSVHSRTQLALRFDDDFYEYSPDMKGYFQRYSGQEGVLFDEIGGFSLNMLKVLLHPGRITVPVKYGDAPWMAKVIYINSNHSPDDWFWRAVRDDSEAVLPLWRVFKCVRVWDHPYDAASLFPLFQEFVRSDSDVGGSALRSQVMRYWGEIRVSRGLSREEQHDTKDYSNKY